MKHWLLIPLLLLPIQSLATAKCEREVVVAVVDTGVDYTHEMLKDNVWFNPGETGTCSSKYVCVNKRSNKIDDDKNAFVDDYMGFNFVKDTNDPLDTHGHGTHISGIVTGVPQIKRNICIKIMALKYYDNSGLGYNNLNNTIRAFYYAIQNGANIINYSGGGADPSPAEEYALKEAEKKGILVVAAAGNDGHNNEFAPYYPASYKLNNIISVASTNTPNGTLIPSSNYGKTVTLAAHGLSVFSLLPNNRQGTMSGTSQATAYVTNAAAELALRMKKFDYKKIKEWLSRGAIPIKDNYHPIQFGNLSLENALILQRKELDAHK